ncbi:hypothetical protein NKH18_35800 [Streptomyces sp. M10(2022)]
MAILSEAESDRLWAARPTPLHAMTTASRQSEPIEDIALLQEEADRLSAGAPAAATGAFHRLPPGAGHR